MFKFVTTDAILAIKGFAAAGAVFGAVAPTLLQPAALNTDGRMSPSVAFLSLVVDADDEAFKNTAKDDIMPSSLAPGYRSPEPFCPPEEGLVESSFYPGHFAWVPEDGIRAGWGRSWVKLLPPKNWGGEWLLTMGCEPGGEESLAKRLEAARTVGLRGSERG